MHLGRRDKVPFPTEYNGFRLIRTHGRVFAFPPHLDFHRITHTPGLMFRHSGVLSAASLDELRALVDGYDHASARPVVLKEVEGYALVRHRERFYAVPGSAAHVDFDCADDRQRAGAIPGATAEDLERTVRQLATGAPVEFGGWMPVFKVSGNCGAHPQFKHTGTPPPGYRFTHTPPPQTVDQPSRLGALVSKVWGKVARGARQAYYLARVPLTFVLPAKGVSLGTRWAVFVAFVNLFFYLLRRGGKPLAILNFLRTRHLTSQLQLGKHDLVFLTSMPYTFGQNPWVIEIEDPTTLFYPLIQNGHTCGLDLRASPYFPIVKALLEHDSCKAILTHMRSTAELVGALFESDAIRAKVLHAPLGVKLPARFQAHEPRPAPAPVNLLFINSWCQVPENFCVRGGLDVLEAFAVLKRKYPNLTLTIRTQLPALDDHYLRILEQPGVRVISRFLSDDEMAELHASSDVFLLPAARVHIVSLLQAMSYGLAVVGSDGWGMEEYLEDGRNGLVVRGRYGVASWADTEAGMLRENYEPMYTPDARVVAGIVEAVSRLVEDAELRRELGTTARADVREKYTAAAWNAGMKAALDRAGLPAGATVVGPLPLPTESEVEPLPVPDRCDTGAKCA
jgi:glycosyltransferase involved in cell wall biosynthesis